MINFDQGKHVLDYLVKPYLSAYMGSEWEHIFIEYLLASFNPIRDPFLYSNFSQWWGGNKKTKSQIEIDCISTYEDKALFGECKWTKETVNEDIVIKLQNTAEQFNYKFKYYYLLSKSGFIETLYEQASKDNTHKLISLEEVYNYIKP